MCLNASTTVTIPLTGQADVTIYDQVCSPLSAAGATAVQQTPAPANWNATTAPGFTGDATGLHFKSNGASSGLAGTVKVTHPSGQFAILAFVVGAPVTAISFGTTTP